MSGKPQRTNNRNQSFIEKYSPSFLFRRRRPHTRREREREERKEKEREVRWIEKLREKMKERGEYERGRNEKGERDKRKRREGESER